MTGLDKFKKISEVLSQIDELKLEVRIEEVSNMRREYSFSTYDHKSYIILFIDSHFNSKIYFWLNKRYVSFETFLNEIPNHMQDVLIYHLDLFR